MDKNGQSLDKSIGENDIFSSWEILINKYDSVNELKAFLSGFTTD